MNDSSDARPNPEPRHPIRVVAGRTGLTPTLLRAWERRYGLVEPGRSDGGQRLYSDADIERLVLLKHASDAGRAIGQIAELGTDALRDLVAEDRQARREVPAVAAPAIPPRDALAQALEAVERMDAVGLETTLRRAVVTLGAAPFIEELVAPLLRQIGERWRQGDLRPAHEHVATVVVARVIDWMIEPTRASDEGPVAVIGTLAGEEHGLGALLAAATASVAGWRVTYLGSDLPPEDIGLAARERGATLVGISVVNPLAADGAPAKVRALIGELPEGATLVLGGPAAVDVANAVADSRLRAEPSLAGFRTLLAELGQRPTTGR